MAVLGVNHEKKGFCNRWVDLIMDCLGSTSYQVLVNGVLRGDIRPTRGIWQGDPFSPFLFLLCTEGLHELITKAATDGELKGFFICRLDLQLIHLFFIDDNLLFCRDNSEECGNILC